MGKNKKKKVKNRFKGAVVIVLLAVAVMIAVLVFMPQNKSELGGEKSNYEASVEESSSDESESTANVNEIEFPIVLEDGKLEVENLFLFEGINPDCNDQEGADIAAVTVKNLCDTYISKADIRIQSSDGINYCFVVTDLPAGTSAVAFATDNAAAEMDASYVEAACDVTFDTEASMNTDLVNVSVDGMHITLQNTGDTEIEEIMIYCHSTLGEEYFGGITYTYTINNLPANGTAELDAVDCILGLVEVVRIAVNE